MNPQDMTPLRVSLYTIVSMLVRVPDGQVMAAFFAQADNVSKLRDSGRAAVEAARTPAALADALTEWMSAEAVIAKLVSADSDANQTEPALRSMLEVTGAYEPIKAVFGRALPGVDVETFIKVADTTIKGGTVPNT
jgi:hypothetical protein